MVVDVVWLVWIVLIVLVRLVVVCAKLLFVRFVIVYCGCEVF